MLFRCPAYCQTPQATQTRTFRLESENPRNLAEPAKFLRAVLSQCHSIDEPAANFRGGSSGGSGRGRAARGVSPWSSFCCLRFSFARRLPLPASAPASAPVSAARRSVGGLARACGARHARARLRRGGGGGDGARRGGRLAVFLAPRVARCCAGAGSVWALPRFFSRSVRTPDARGRSGWSSGRWVGALWRNRASKTRAIDYFCLPGGL